MPFCRYLIYRPALRAGQGQGMRSAPCRRREVSHPWPPGVRRRHLHRLTARGPQAEPDGQRVAVGQSGQYGPVPSQRQEASLRQRDLGQRVTLVLYGDRSGAARPAGRNARSSLRGTVRRVPTIATPGDTSPSRCCY